MAAALKSPVPSSERGIALISALMVLVLASILGVTFIATNASERSITSNVHVARASLLSADAGVRITQQKLANLFRAKLDSALNVYTGTGLILPAGFSLASGTLSYSSTNPAFNSTATITYADTNLAATAQTYVYRYTINSLGSAGGTGSGSRQVQSSGYLQVSADRGTFAQYLLFTNQHTTQSGGSIWFTSSSQFDGKVHTNGQFRFAYQPGFTDLTTQVNNKAWFYNKNNPTKELAASYNGTIDVPNFFGGFTRNAPSVTLPTNSYNQQNAALGLDPTSSSVPSTAAIRTALGITTGSGVPNDIYVVNSGGAMTGGIYIQGNADQVKCVADTVNGKQVYVIRQGSTTKTITVDPAAGTTTMLVGSTTTTYTGVPRSITYCNGAISDLRGPDRSSGQPIPGILRDQQIMIAATGDIVLQRDLVVEDYNTSQAVVGIYSSGGNVRVGGSAPNDMYLDAYVMATGGGTTGQGVLKVDNHDSGSPRGTFHLRGGMIAQYYGAFFTFDVNGNLQTGYARDFRYDRRGYVPPYFPTTPQMTRTNDPSARTLAWKEI